MRCLSQEATVREHSRLQTREEHRDQILHFPLFPGGLLITPKPLAGTQLLSEQRDVVWRGSNVIGICNSDISILRFRKTCCLQHLNEEWQHAVARPGSSGRRDRPDRQTTPFPVLTSLKNMYSLATRWHGESTHGLSQRRGGEKWGVEGEQDGEIPGDFRQTILGLPLSLTGVMEGRDKRRRNVYYLTQRRQQSGSPTSGKLIQIFH